MVKANTHQRKATRGEPIGAARALARWVGCAAMLLLGGLVAGCAAARPVFGKVDPPIGFPAAKPRIVYVGQLTGSDDLKRPRGALQVLGEAILGRKDAHLLVSPVALCTDGADRVFVADTGAQVVHVFDLKQRRYEQWKPAGSVGFTQPVGVAWDPQGRLIVSDSAGGRLFAFDADGKYQGELAAGIVRRPTGVVVEPASRRILVADVEAHQVLVLAPDGALIERIGRRGTALGEFNYPTHLALDGGGYLYVSDALNFRIQVFNPAGKVVRGFGHAGDAPGYLGQPKGLGLDSEGHVYVVDARQDMVQIFDGDARLLLHFGGEGRGAGQFWLPAGIVIDAHNRIWIADTYNRRVSVFDYVPEGRP